MARLRIAPIVEGKGEVQCVPTLLRRIWKEIGGEYAEILSPLHHPRSELIRRDGLRGAVEKASIILAGRSNPSLPGLVLVLLDSDEPDDENCPARLGPRLREFARGVDPRFGVSCVVANVEYETWFVASAESLIMQGHLRLKPGEAIPGDPEGQRLRKRWIEDRYAVKGVMRQNRQYKPTVDQLPMTRAMDLAACRAGAPSFDKLCRELEKWITPSGPHA
jgi:hypothetical protein